MCSIREMASGHGERIVGDNSLCDGAEHSFWRQPTYLELFTKAEKSVLTVRRGVSWVKWRERETVAASREWRPERMPTTYERLPRSSSDENSHHRAYRVHHYFLDCQESRRSSYEVCAPRRRFWGERVFNPQLGTIRLILLGMTIKSWNAIRSFIVPREYHQYEFPLLPLKCCIRLTSPIGMSCEKKLLAGNPMNSETEWGLASYLSAYRNVI